MLYFVKRIDLINCRPESWSQIFRTELSVYLSSLQSVKEVVCQNTSTLAEGRAYKWAFYMPNPWALKRITNMLSTQQVRHHARASYKMSHEFLFFIFSVFYIILQGRWMFIYMCNIIKGLAVKNIFINLSCSTGSESKSPEVFNKKN